MKEKIKKMKENSEKSSGESFPGGPLGNLSGGILRGIFLGGLLGNLFEGGSPEESSILFNILFKINWEAAHDSVRAALSQNTPPHRQPRHTTRHTHNQGAGYGYGVLCSGAVFSGGSSGESFLDGAPRSACKVCGGSGIPQRKESGPHMR